MAYDANSVFSPTVYSGITLFNPTSKIDKTCLTINYWKTTLRLSIIPIIETESTNENPKYDYKNSISIYLTPIKSALFAKVLKLYKQDPTKYEGYGIATPQSIITVDSPATFQKDSGGPVISIRKVNDDGSIEASYSYECNTTNFVSVVGFNERNPREFQQDSQIFKDAEIDTVIMQLETYYKAMSNSNAFTVVNTLYPYLDRIASKLGVDLTGSTRKSSVGFFSGNNVVGNPNNGFVPNQTTTIGQMNQFGGAPTQNSSQPTYDASQLKSLISDT